MLISKRSALVYKNYSLLLVVGVLFLVKSRATLLITKERL